MIELPERFANDIQGKDTYLVPLVVINNSVYLSTGKTTLDGVNYNPLIKSLGSIKQSVDLIEKKFKISSVNMDFYNYDYNNTTLTETMFSSEIMNRPIDVYFKSPSAETLDDCLKVYTGYVKNISENIDIVRLEIEDRTEQTLHKDLPYRYTSSINVPDKHKNIPIPIVYGIVDKVPLVYEGLITPSEYSLIADDFYIRSINTPQVFHDDIYGVVKEEPDFFETIIGDTIYSLVDISKQYEIIESTNQIIFPKVLNYNSAEDNIDGLTGTPIAFNFVDVKVESPVYFGESPYRQSATPTGGDYVEQTTEALAFTDLEGTIPTTKLSGAYVMVKNFADMIWERWSWNAFTEGHDRTITNEPDGGNDWSYVDQGDWGTLMNEPLINCEVEQFFSEGSFVTELDKRDGLEKIIKNKVEVNLSASAEIVNGSPNANNPGNITHGWRPAFMMIWEKINNIIWLPEEDNPDENSPVEAGDGEGWDDPYIISINKTSELLTDKITANKFVVGNRQWVYDPYPNPSAIQFIQNSAGSVNWINFENFTINRHVVLNSFDTYDLYATVHGRVDNMEGRYTGLSTLSAEQMRNYVEGKKPMLQGKAIAPTRPSARKPVARIPIKKKKIKSKSTKGGY